MSGELQQGACGSWDIAQAIEQMLPCVCVFLQPGSAYGCRRAKDQQAKIAGIPHDTSPLTIHVAVHVLLVLVYQSLAEAHHWLQKRLHCVLM